MKLLMLLFLGLTLVCAHAEGNHEVVTSNFDMLKVSGEWYTIYLASDRKEKIEENGSMRLFVENIQILQNSSLLLNFDKMVNGECTEISLVCNETEEEDEYSVFYDGQNTFHIIEADYNDYLMFHVLNSNNDIETKVMGLYARDPDVLPQLKKRFEKRCQKNGIAKKNVLDLTKVDRCLQSRGSYGDQASSSQ